MSEMGPTHRNKMQFPTVGFHEKKINMLLKCNFERNTVKMFQTIS